MQGGYEFTSVYDQVGTARAIYYARYVGGCRSARAPLRRGACSIACSIAWPNDPTMPGFPVIANGSDPLFDQSFAAERYPETKRTPLSGIQTGS